jgi:HSP20 family protein
MKPTTDNIEKEEGTMNLVRWQPKAMARGRLGSFDGELDRLFDWASQAADQGCGCPMVPAMDVTEEDNRYVVRADLPGLTKDEIEITFQGGVLTLKGEKKAETKVENGRTYCRERFEGKFARNLQLPEKVDVNAIEATMKDGVLELILPFSPEAQPRKIQVNG